MTDPQRWQDCLTRIRDEFAALPIIERDWIRDNLRAIHAQQRRLHDFFEAADGGRHCATCAGACCARGRNHLTLVNLLGYLAADEEPPTPDFTVTCPFLGPAGCRLDVSRRPFNCVTFLCDVVENALDEPSRKAFYQLEAEVRQIYEAFDRRYAGSSLRGLLIRAERLGNRAFLARL
ncbi:hypothetical protein [Trichloromonas sp.]|uniref:hypothetical protein n=1 Tax=Trichloromonas sp. TaxID=3069249 RepID=UPI002A47A153|nr:hypothetical protein [Trichloromonas sp.]